MTVPAPASESDRSKPRRLCVWMPVIVVAGLLLHLPALWMGFYADDYLHQLVLRGETPMKPWALFDFGYLADWEGGQDPGSIPWWTSLDWKARFFRPLASLSLWLDHALFGEAPVGYHVTSLVLYALLLVLVYDLYQVLGLSRRVALWALALFVCSTESALPVAWLANRNSLLAVLFTTAAICAVSRYRRWGLGAATATALGCGVLAALSKESGTAAFLLVAAYLWRERSASADPRERRRQTAVAAMAAGLSVVHAGVLLLGDYGTNSLFYSMPWSQPAAYLERLGMLVATSGLALASPASTDVLTVMPELTLPFLALATPVTLALALWVWRSLREEASIGFFALWMALTLLPQAAAQLSDRLLFGASVASSAFVALLVTRAFRRDGPRRVITRVAAGALLLVAGPLSAVGLVGQVGFLVGMAKDLRDATLSADVGPAELGHREVFVLQAHNAFVPFVIHTTWGIENDDHDLTFRVLQGGRRGIEWTREDERSCTFTALGERPFLDDPFEYVYRSHELDAVPGTIWQVEVFQVEAVDVDERGLRSIRVRFDESLDTPRYRFLVDRDGRLTSIAPPAVGETIVVPEVAGPVF